MRGGGGGVEKWGVFEKNSWVFWFFGGFFGGGTRGILRGFLQKLSMHPGVSGGWGGGVL